MLTGALGGFIGGLFGAGGAAGSVYLLIARQRQEELQRSIAAVQLEISLMVIDGLEKIATCGVLIEGYREQGIQYADPRTIPRLIRFQSPVLLTGAGGALGLSEQGLDFLSAFRSAQGFNDDAERIMRIPTNNADEIVERLGLLRDIAHSIINQCRAILPKGYVENQIARWSRTLDQASLQKS